MNTIERVNALTDRMKNLEIMDTIIRNHGDEEAWMEWIMYGVPDWIDEDRHMIDLLELALDENLFNDCLEAFRDVCGEYDIETPAAI